MCDSSCRQNDMASGVDLMRVYKNKKGLLIRQSFRYDIMKLLLLSVDCVFIDLSAFHNKDKALLRISD